MLARYLCRFTLMLGLSISSLAYAQSTPAAKPEKPAKPTKPEVRAPAPPESDAIRASARAFEAAFNKGDAQAIAALWTADGDYHDEAGDVYQGRAAIADGYAKFFATHPNAQIKIIVDSVKLLSESAAIEDGRALLEPQDGAPAISKYTVVHVKDGGKWLMSTVRDTRVETPSTYPHLADLDWLVGHWSAEEHGNKTEYVCRWIANKSFLERRYTVTHHDQSVTTGVQIVGWNAIAGHVQSWNFASGGGFALGDWQPHGNGWAAEVQGFTGDGVPTSALNIFTKLDDNTFAWQSVQRTAGDQSLPDTDEVIVKRQNETK